MDEEPTVTLRWAVGHTKARVHVGPMNIGSIEVRGGQWVAVSTEPGRPEFTAQSPEEAAGRLARYYARACAARR